MDGQWTETESKTSIALDLYAYQDIVTCNRTPRDSPTRCPRRCPAQRQLLGPATARLSVDLMVEIAVAA